MLVYFVLGMAKSALEAINGCNLFGEKGASWSVVYVDIDAHNRNRSIFETMLPRESSSKVCAYLTITTCIRTCKTLSLSGRGCIAAVDALLPSLCLA